MHLHNTDREFRLNIQYLKSINFRKETLFVNITINLLNKISLLLSIFCLFSTFENSPFKKVASHGLKITALAFYVFFIKLLQLCYILDYLFFLSSISKSMFIVFQFYFFSFLPFFRYAEEEGVYVFIK